MLACSSLQQGGSSVSRRSRRGAQLWGTGCTAKGVVPRGAPPAPPSPAYPVQAASSSRLFDPEAPAPAVGAYGPAEAPNQPQELTKEDWLQGEFLLCGAAFTYYSAKAYISTRMRGYTEQQRVSPADEEMLLQLLKFHPRYRDKVGAGISHFTVQTTAQGTICFWLHRHDHSSSDFSYLKCLAGYAYMHLTERVDQEGNPVGPIPESISPPPAPRRPRADGFQRRSRPRDVPPHMLQAWEQELNQGGGYMGAPANAPFQQYDTQQLQQYGGYIGGAPGATQAQYQQPQAGAYLQGQQEGQGGMQMGSLSGSSSWDDDMFASQDFSTMMDSAPQPWQQPQLQQQRRQQWQQQRQQWQPGQQRWGQQGAAPTWPAAPQPGQQGAAQGLGTGPTPAANATGPQQQRGGASAGLQQQQQQEELSWRDCLLALRAAVAPQLRAYKTQALAAAQAAGGPTCALTGQPLTPATASVGYAPPQDLKQLAIAWMKSQGLTHRRQLGVAMVSAGGQSRPAMTDQQLVASWQGYHALSARLLLRKGRTAAEQ